MNDKERIDRLERLEKLRRESDGLLNQAWHYSTIAERLDYEDWLDYEEIKSAIEEEIDTLISEMY